MDVGPLDEPKAVVPHISANNLYKVAFTCLRVNFGDFLEEDLTRIHLNRLVLRVVLAHQSNLLVLEFVYLAECYSCTENCHYLIVFKFAAGFIL